MLKFFRVPFALSGNRTPIPDAADANGFVSYIEGYGPDYQRAKTDVLSKNIERDKMNELFFDITNAIAEIQAQGVPDWITTVLNGGSPFSYAKNAIVRYTDGNVYMSLVAANTAAPTDATKWAPLSASGLLDRLSLINPFKAVGDGSTSDQTPVANAIAALRDRILTNEGYKFLVTSISNPRGVDLGSAFGHIVKNITGGQQKLNSPGDRDKYVFGQEYLAAFHNLLIAQTTTPTRKPIMVFSGDSTTAGDGVSADYQIQALVKGAAEARGLQTPYGLSVVNRGQSGQMTQQWVDTWLAGDLAANPDVLVLRWGINDPGYLQSGGTIPVDSGQNFPNRRTPADFITSLRAGLTTIRASRGVASLSIVLMSMNPTSDTPNARDELWQEQVIPGIKQAARDFNCCFIDTFHLLRDARPAAGVWMDNPFADGRAIHPLNVMNTWISSVLSDVLFPFGLQSKIGQTNSYSTAGLENAGGISSLPADYRRGRSLSRAGSASGFPVDGNLITTRSMDDTVMQTVFPFNNAERGQLWVRYGRAAVLSGEAADWSAWFRLGYRVVNIAPASGYTAPGGGQMRVGQSGHVQTVEGYLTKASPAIIAAGTLLGTIPATAGMRPTQESVYGQLATIYDGTNFETRLCRIATDGTVTLLQASTLSASRVYVNASWITP